MNFRMRFKSFFPGADSTPEETSTMGAPVTRMAFATFSGVSPPERIKPSDWDGLPRRFQSKATPLPPGNALTKASGAFVVDADDAALQDIKNTVAPDLYQTHGAETPERVLEIGA